MKKDFDNKVAFLLDGFGNRRHLYQIEALIEKDIQPKIITFLDPKSASSPLRDYALSQNLVIFMPFRRQEVTKRFSFSFALNLLHTLKKEDIKVVLTHRFKLLRYLWFCKLFHPNLKVIFHLVIASAIKGWHQRFLFRKFRRLTDKILVNSSALKEELITKGLVGINDVEIFYSGVDLNDFVVNQPKALLRRSFNLPENSTLLGMIANFRKEKDQNGLLKALKILKNKKYEVRLILAGDGPFFSETKRLAENLKLQEDVFFLGRIDPREVPLLLSALDIFVYATFREGMPLAVLEAMASGLPIIATDAEGIPDLFQDEITFGIMVPKGDPQALASAIERILNLPEDERLALGKNAREVVAKRFSAEILKQNTIKLFEKLLNPL
ncbi:MAG: glycosyltransferase family 4 protein [Caldimicrobium sp.]|nr:glycosyltransferase family 4 protein [Caldimicrobium sp.]MDW8181981.1 glycosyltransferase family 4 protein [Caldimicrobium sp.]